MHCLTPLEHVLIDQVRDSTLEAVHRLGQMGEHTGPHLGSDDRRALQQVAQPPLETLDALLHEPASILGQCDLPRVTGEAQPALRQTDQIPPVEEQSAWLEQQLATTNATWKFAVFHFPPYNAHYDYGEIRR